MAKTISPGRQVAPSTSLMANASAGLFGLQIVWGLQSVTTSRILQSLGAETVDLAFLWVAAPLSGLVVQPLVGWLSDRTRSRFGSRRPYILLGAVLSAAALSLMGGATTLAAAVVALWLMTFSVNIAMQPMRALIADLLHRDDVARGYSVQVVFIGAGAIFASCLPWLMARVPAVDPTASGFASSLGLAFLVGAATLLASVGWTLTTVREHQGPTVVRPASSISIGYRSRPVLWLSFGAALGLASLVLDVRREIWLLAGVVGLYGLLEFLATRIGRARRPSAVQGVFDVIQCIATLPTVLRRLSVVQFFTWFALFTVWVYAVPTIAAYHYGDPSPGTPAYDAAADWVGVLFGVQDATTILVALMLPRLMDKIGIARSHAVCLTIGAISFVAMTLVPGGQGLIWPWVGVGVAWASILLAPYAMVARSVSPEAVGLNLGVHNIFLVLPQLVGASVLGFVVQTVFHGRLELILPLAASSFLIAAVLCFRLEQTETLPTPVNARYCMMSMFRR